MTDYTLPLDELPDPLPIVPLERPFDVTITPPGSKSITCRAYVLAALANGESRIIRPLRADDTDRLLAALCTLGAQARWEGEDVLITGVDGRFPHGGSVNLGDGGTPTRFMIACACLAAEPVVVDGSRRMRERPIAEGVDMLRELGAHIEYVEEEGRLPVRVVPSEEFNGGELKVGKTASSQFISAVMLIAPCLPGGVRLIFDHNPTSADYVYLTTWTMEQWLLRLDIGDTEGAGPISVHHGGIRSGEYTIEADASSCAYWHEAAAICPGSRAVVPMQPMASNQPDRGVGMDIVTTFGGEFQFIVDGSGASAVVGPERLGGDRPTIDASQMPDGSLAVSVVCSRADTTSCITGLHTLRIKETDRIAALANELRRVGCTVETTDDSITIDPSTRHDEPVVIETYHDHRMAMAFAVLGLARPGISIRNPACVAKSYPTFWRDFAKLYQGGGSDGP